MHKELSISEGMSSYHKVRTDREQCEMCAENRQRVRSVHERAFNKKIMSLINYDVQSHPFLTLVVFTN